MFEFLMMRIKAEIYEGICGGAISYAFDLFIGDWSSTINMEITPGLFRPQPWGTPRQNENLDPEGVDVLFGDELLMAVSVHADIITDGRRLR